MKQKVPQRVATRPNKEQTTPEPPQIPLIIKIDTQTNVCAFIAPFAVLLEHLFQMFRQNCLSLQFIPNQTAPKEQIKTSFYEKQRKKNPQKTHTNIHTKKFHHENRNWGLQGYSLFFLLAVLMSTHNLCLEQKYEKISQFLI